MLQFIILFSIITAFLLLIKFMQVRIQKGSRSYHEQLAHYENAWQKQCRKYRLALLQNLRNLYFDALYQRLILAFF